MCSIMGYCGPAADREAFQKGFQRTVSRGPDDDRVVEAGGGLLGFHRLAIMGLTPAGMQPFRLQDSYVVCNGEIYGFGPLKQALEERGYAFQSSSDCEILLPLYREIFERYYPGQSQMIPGFWMPNKAWAGCDVDDPSARVLANYGGSGI